MKVSRVGQYRLGPHEVGLSIDFKVDGAYFAMCNNKSGLPEIVVGGDEKWCDVVANLLHELMEMAFVDVRARFRPTPDHAFSTDGYVFHADHSQFSEAAARAGHFLSDCVPDLAREYQAGLKTRRK